MILLAALARRRAYALVAFIAMFGAVALATQPASAATTGSGNAATETRTAGGIQAVAIRGSIDLIVRQGASESVPVRADDNILPQVQTTVDGSGDLRTLRIGFKPGESVNIRTPVVATVDVIELTAISSAGSGDITVEPLKTPMLKVRISGSSEAKPRQLDTEQLSVSVADIGSVLASGHAATPRIAGTGSVRRRQP